MNELGFVEKIKFSGARIKEKIEEKTAQPGVKDIIGLVRRDFPHIKFESIHDYEMPYEIPNSTRICRGVREDLSGNNADDTEHVAAHQYFQHDSLMQEVVVHGKEKEYYCKLIRLYFGEKNLDRMVEYYRYCDEAKQLVEIESFVDFTPNATKLEETLINVVNSSIYDSMLPSTPILYNFVCLNPELVGSYNVSMSISNASQVRQIRNFSVKSSDLSPIVSMSDKKYVEFDRFYSGGILPKKDCSKWVEFNPTWKEIDRILSVYNNSDDIAKIVKFWTKNCMFNGWPKMH